MTEKELITKYVPSYVDPNNPSSWASVSGFSADEILNGPESVYGLMSDTRLEISSLLKHLGTIDEATDYLQPTKKYSTGKFRTYQDYLATNPKITIHDYYDEVKRRVVEADKNEKK